MKLDLSVDEKARLLGLPVVNLFQKKANFQSLLLIPESFASKNKIICFDLSEDKIKIATAFPEEDANVLFLEDLKNKEKKIIEVYVTSIDAINYSLEWYKDENIDTNIVEKIEKQKEKEEQKIKVIEELKSYSSIDEILDHAIKFKAKEIHLECVPEYARIFYHVNGLHEIAKIPEPSGSKLVNDIKEMSHLRENHIHQKGDFFKLHDNQFFHIITTIFPLPIGIRVNIEINKIEEDRFNLAKLGMQEEVIKKVLNSLKNDNGIYIVTGPPGSGRTYTIYALLSLFLRKGKKISTIENGIECFVDGFNQTEVRPQEGKTYAFGLKQASKNGANVILIDGLRDLQTANIVKNEVYKNKIIIVPFADNSIFQVIYHLEELGFTKEEIVNNLKMIINQRLLLKLCPNCRLEKVPEIEESEEIKKLINNLPKMSKHSNIKIKEYMHSGCTSCSETGFSGHIGIFEVLPINNEVKDAILKGNIEQKEKELLKNNGLLSLKQDGIIKVLEGITTLSELYRVS
ncbi:MAG: ATPase, T2SS/T4P/T4SS family [Candidatus Woesearchaeota archaeon]